MILLFDPMSLITPDLGFTFWTFLAFVIFWIIAGKFAVKPIVSSIEARNQKIEDELLSAQKARLEFEALKSQNDDLLKEAREERHRLLVEAKQDADNFRSTELAKAKEDAARLLDQAKNEIENQKRAAISEVKKEVGAISISIAEKLVREKLTDNASQQSLVTKLVNESLSSN
ncbi:MAG: F0F1 ATP synthase subunit B [Chitinophagales bacterium]|jgi:F-type H+-transporting ATPase subunit b|nr:F0F1 ATP synthase subunit B [Sphingobacteriales bacterium]